MNWNYHVRHEMLLRGKEERNIIHTIKGGVTGLVTSCVGIAF
jgi:hypothetical protein